MRWAKERPAPRYDLAGSNLSPCTLADLPGAREALELTGPNPDGIPPLVEAIAARYGAAPDQVAVAAGCSGANFQAFAALVRPGDEVVVERPGYDPLLGALALLGADLRRFDRRPQDGWAVDPDRVAAAITERTRLVVVTSPHNPTGVLVAPGALAALTRRAESAGAYLLVDEVYQDAVYGDRPVPAGTTHPRLITTNSLTKAYGLPGLRCGWVIGAPEVIRAVRQVRDVLDVSGAYPAERLALLAFQQLSALERRARGIIEPNARRLAAFVRAHAGLEWTPPDGGTVAFLRLLGHDDTRPFADTLLRGRGTALVPGAFFEAPDWIRVAFGGDPAGFVAGLDALGAALDSR